MIAVWLAWLIASVLQTPARDTPGRPTAGTAAIAGVVRSDETPARPVRRALVTLSAGGRTQNAQAVTDEAGRFVFAGLLAGRYTLTAEKAAFVKTFFGSRRPGRSPASPMAVADGQVLTIDITLVRGAVIAGVVSDENGTPLASAQVTTYEPVLVSGERKLVGIYGALPWATTDERGRYRLYGLAPGEYAVKASGSASTGMNVIPTTEADVQAAMRDLQLGSSSAPTSPRESTAEQAPAQVMRRARYFPSAPDGSGAQILSLKAGEERDDVNITVTLERANKFEGVSVGPGGQPIRNAMISVVNLADRSVWSSPGAVRPDAEGRFRVTGLPPGHWGLVANGSEAPLAPGGPTEMPLYAEAEVFLDNADVSGVVLQFSPGLTASGRLTFDGKVPVPNLSALRVSAFQVDAILNSLITVPVAPAADGTFELKGLAPGKYRVGVGGSSISPWTLRSAMLHGRETLDAPFTVAAGQSVSGLDLRFTDQPSVISGSVLDRLGRPAPEYSVVVFSADRAHWMTSPRRLSGAVKVGSDGRYSVTGLPPGDYYISVLTDIDSRQASDPVVLESLVPASLRISLAEGEKKTQDLRLGG